MLTPGGNTRKQESGSGASAQPANTSLSSWAAANIAPAVEQEGPKSQQARILVWLLNNDGPLCFAELKEVRHPPQETQCDGKVFRSEGVTGRSWEFDVKGSAPAAQLILELPKESGDKSLGSYLIRDTVAKGAAAMRSLSIDQTKHVISYLEGINAGLSLFGEANRSEGKSKRPILEARSSNLFRDGPAASKSPFLAELLDKVSALQLTGDTLPPDSNIIAEKRGANWTYIMQLPTPIRAAAGLRGWLSAKIDSLADTMGWVRPKATPRLLGEFCLCSPEKGTYQARAEDALTKRTISQDFKSLPEALLYTHGLMRGALIRAG